MNRVRTVTAAALLLVAAPALAGCAAGGGAETAAMCSTFEQAGGTLATIGPVSMWVPKEDLLASVTAKLDAMGDSTPPADIADSWDAVKTHYESILEEAEALPAGGTLTGSELLQEATTMTEHTTAVAGFISDNC